MQPGAPDASVDPPGRGPGRWRLLYDDHRLRRAVSLAFVTAFATACYTFLLLLWSLRIALDDWPGSSAIVGFAPIAFLIATATGVYSYRRALLLTSCERHALTVGAGNGLALTLCSLVTFLLFELAGDFIGEPLGRIWYVFPIGAWALAPFWGFYRYRCERRRASALHSAAAPPDPEVLARYYRARRRNALVIGLTASAATCLVPTQLLLAYMLADGDVYPGTSDRVLFVGLLCAPYVGLLAYRRALWLTGIVLWLRPFHQKGRLQFDRVVKAACIGVGRCITLKDERVSQSIAAAIASRWFLVLFLIPVGLGGAVIAWIVSALVLGTVFPPPDERDSYVAILQQRTLPYEAYLPVAGISGIAIWLCLYVGGLYLYIRRYCAIALQQGRSSERIGRLVAAIRQGRVCGGGVHVLHSEDKFWEEIVTLVVRRADVVIVDVTRVSANIGWEVCEALTHVPAHRILLSYHGRLNGATNIPSGILANLASQAPCDVTSCARVVMDTSASGRAPMQTAAQQLKIVIREGTFEHERRLEENDLIPPDREERFDAIAGWLWLPVGELVISCVLYGFWAVILTLIVLQSGELETDAPVLPEQLASVIRWIWVKSVLLCAFALYLIRGPLARRARSFVPLMAIWFTVRIWWSAIELYAFGRLMWSEASTAGIATSHALSISWLLMMLFLARSKRARRTFNTGLEDQRRADQVFR